MIPTAIRRGILASLPKRSFQEEELPLSFSISETILSTVCAAESPSVLSRIRIASSFLPLERSHLGLSGMEHRLPAFYILFIGKAQVRKIGNQNAESNHQLEQGHEGAPVSGRRYFRDVKRD